MAETIRVFVGSSSEAIIEGGPADVLRTLLQEHVGDKARVEPWTKKFRLSAAYIESLERMAAKADFAVFVATPDDPASIRGEALVAPRDNVTFELGLFMGALGRERCFLVRSADRNLRIPTDLLGVEAAVFEIPVDGDLTAALERSSRRIVGRIHDLGLRERFTPDAVIARKRKRAFAGRIEGTWWERIRQRERQDAGALSFFRIAPDAIEASVTLDGRTYAFNGAPAANWHSELVRLDTDRRRLLHVWTGRAVRPDVANRSFNGFGEMNFDPAEDGTPLLGRGHGMFWNVDEAHPEDTINKPIELRREAEPRIIETMTRGSQGQKRELVKQMIEEW